MSAPATPFTVSANLSYPADVGLPATDHPASGAGTYQSLFEDVYNLSGSGTQAVNFGTVATGVKALQVKVDPDSVNPTVPVNIRFNSSTDNVQLTPGGSFLYHNPSPQSGGVTGLNILYTQACVVRVRGLG